MPTKYKMLTLAGALWLLSLFGATTAPAKTALSEENLL